MTVPRSMILRMLMVEVCCPRTSRSGKRVGERRDLVLQRADLLRLLARVLGLELAPGLPRLLVPAALQQLVGGTRGRRARGGYRAGSIRGYRARAARPREGNR